MFQLKPSSQSLNALPRGVGHCRMERPSFFRQADDLDMGCPSDDEVFANAPRMAARSMALIAKKRGQVELQWPSMPPCHRVTLFSQVCRPRPHQRHLPPAVSRSGETWQLTTRTVRTTATSRAGTCHALFTSARMPSPSGIVPQSPSNLGSLASR